MSKGCELAISGQGFQGINLQTAVIVLKITKNPGLADQEATVNPAFADLRFLGEIRNHIPVEDQTAEPCRGPDCRNSCYLPVGPMELEQVVEINIADSIAVSEHEGTITEERFESFETSARIGLLSGVLEMNNPVFRFILSVDPTAGKVDTHAAVKQMKIHEEAFDDFTTISQGDEKLFQTELSVVLHDVPENRPPSDFNHRFRSNLRLFG